MKSRNVFYHADRRGLLNEGQDLLLNQDGLSFFGEVYVPIIYNTPFELLNNAQRREFLLEHIRLQPEYADMVLPSRFQSIFGANSIPEAEVFAQEIVPKPIHPVRIFEVFCDNFRNLDSNCIDFLSSSRTSDNFYNYWGGRITNHRPSEGPRRPPRIEVLISLPAIVGRVVKTVFNDHSGTPIQVYDE